VTPGALTLAATLPPLAAFLVVLVVLRRRTVAAAAVTIGCTAVSAVAALVLLSRGPLAEPVTWRWMVLGTTELRFGFLLDGPNLLFGFVVALIALLVQIYSLGYMARDPGWGRYYAMMGLFAWSMLSFVYAANLLQTFLFWELVGLASFFLIAFWYEKPAAAAAGRKAFLMTRIGDVGMFVGLILLWQATDTLDIRHVVSPEVVASIPAATLTAIGLLLFLGVVGKSAQFPLHTWLPDAMEGPTPVSALLHSATMVAAGVFLFARFHPVFLASDTVVHVVLAVAAFTAILSATIAIVMQDVKRVLAYSSISQLSFMLLGLAAGSLFAGVFHLVTHAFFKALLFLTAGAFIHRFGTNDAVAIGRAGGPSMRWSALALVVGGAALAGVPPFAGFFSKEEILDAVAGTGSPLLLGATYVGVFLTAYYTFRMVFLVLRPNPQGKLEPEEPAGAHGHSDEHAHGEAPASMLAPVLVLTALTVVAGFAGPWMEHLLGGGDVAHDFAGGGHEAGLPPWIVPVAVTLAAVLIAAAEYARRGAAQTGFVAKLPALRTALLRKWYVDEVYAAIIGRASDALARLLAAIETGVLDRGADLTAALTRAGGGLISRLQNGRLQFYVGSAAVVLAARGWLLGGRGGTP